MEYFFAGPELLRNLIGDRRLYLFLDYDGTLTPIVQRPQDAVLSLETKVLLKDLSKNQRCEIIITSGRAIDDIKKLVGLKNIVYVGNHGMEIEGPDLHYMPPLPSGYKDDLKKINADLHHALGSVEGVLFEDKGLALAVHYRLVRPKAVAELKKNFEKAVSAYVSKKRIAIREGKMVLEVRPPIEWNKGKAVLWLLENIDAAAKMEKKLPIYIGDDLTDEDAFIALKDIGVTIFVGQPGQLHAQYFINEPAEVDEFLRQILNLVRE